MKGILFKEELFCDVVYGTKTETRREAKPGKKPRFKVGDIVFMKEPYQLVHARTLKLDYNNNTCSPASDIHTVALYKFLNPNSPLGAKSIHPWKNKMFMPAKYARYFIEITAVETEHLLDITENGAIAEGVKYIDDNSVNTINKRRYKDYSKNRLKSNVKHKIIINNHYVFKTATESYLSLYRAINKKSKPNPKVFVYKFKLVLL